MRKLIAVTYDTEFKAEEVRLQFLKMQKSYLVSLEDAVVVEKKQNGKVKLHQMYNLTASGAVGGGFWGVLIGLIFMNPLLGRSRCRRRCAERRGHQRRFHEAAC